MGDEEDEGKSASSCNWHSQRHVIVLASLGVGLVATVVVITISVVLQPAHLGFTVESATASYDNNHDQVLKLTVKIAKNTTSGGNVRAKVKYKTVVIYLVTTSAVDKTMAAVAFDSTRDKLPPTLYVNGTEEVIINGKLLLVGNSKTSELGDRVAHKIGVTVVIQAQVSFQIGVVKTVSYDITFSRSGVVFEITG